MSWFNFFKTKKVNLKVSNKNPIQINNELVDKDYFDLDYENELKDKNINSEEFLNILEENYNYFNDTKSIEEEIKKVKSITIIRNVFCEKNEINTDNDLIYKRLISKLLFLESKIIKIEKRKREIIEEENEKLFFLKKRTNRETLIWIINNKENYKKYSLEEFITIEDLTKEESLEMSMLTEKNKNRHETIRLNNLIEKWMKYSLLFLKIENVNKTILEIIADYKEDLKDYIKNEKREKESNQLFSTFSKLYDNKNFIDLLNFISNISLKEIDTILKKIDTEKYNLPFWLIDFLKEGKEKRHLQKKFKNNLSLSIKGVHKPENLKNLQTSDLYSILNLIPEPSNIYDNKAIIVSFNENKIGYIPADRTTVVKNIIEEEYICILVSKNISGYISANVEIIF